MNNTRNGLIVVTFALFLTFTLAALGLFSKKPIYRLPDQAQKAGVMSVSELDHLITNRPQSVHSVTFYKGMRAVLADLEPLGFQLIDYGKTSELLAKVRMAKVKVNIAEPTSASSESFVDTLDWPFWALLGICTAGFATLLWRAGVFSRVPGLETYNPCVAASDCSSAERRTFADIAGAEESIAKLKRVARWLEDPERFEQFGAKLPKGILAVGPPGTGKTLLARALAGEVNANFFPVHASSFIEMFVGVGARRIRKLFEAAAAARKRTGKPSIIFIDEIDAIGKKRSQGGSGSDAERDQTLNQLLVCMQGFEASEGILVMAATNMAQSLDEALTRPGRFDYQVSVDLPDTQSREKIFGIHTRNMTLSPKVNLRDLAIRTPQFSGADIEQACNEAAISAAERIGVMIEEGVQNISAADKEIRVDDFDIGIDYVQFGDPMLSRARSMSQQDKRNTAYHEAGHCAVQQALQKEGADPITKVTIEPRTKSLGSMQSHSENDQYGYTEQQLLARITAAMGGRAAQEHFLGRKDTGASNDFEQGSKLARLMVTEFGLSRLGPIWIAADAPGQKPSVYGYELGNIIDNEWRRIVEDCYDRALKIVKEHDRQVERIADTLLVEQTILGERFRQLWNLDDNSYDEVDAINCSPIAHGR